MDRKQQILQSLAGGGPISLDDAINAMDILAKEFGEWLTKNTIRSERLKNNYQCWRYRCTGELKTIEELYEIFK